MVISVEVVDITTMAVDAIVNAANEGMLGGGGVDGAIHRAAGPQLLEACKRVPAAAGGVRCPTGEARITPAFSLPSRYVIHTVGPVWHGGDSSEHELLSSCYTASLDLAAQHEIRSIAFPMISCGAFGFPPEAASEVAVDTVARSLTGPSSVESVVLVAINAADAGILKNALEARGSSRG